MSKAQQIQIPKQAFLDLYLLIIALNDYDLEPDIKKRVNALEMAIDKKLEAMARRTAFTEYKTADQNTEDRETKRRKYLELAGLHQDWISQKETPH